MANDAPKRVTKESLHGELTGLLTTTHGEIKEAAESIAKALEELIKHETVKNKARFEEVVRQAMAVPQSSHFKVADSRVRAALLGILENAKEVIHTGLHNLIEANQKIKEERKKLKERIQEIENQARPGRGLRS